MSQITAPQRIEGRYFDGLRENSGRTIEGYDLERCIFQSCDLSRTVLDPSKRSVVRNVRLKDCMCSSSSVGCAILDEVVIDGLDTGPELLFGWGTAFRHVTFRGRIGHIKVNRTYRGHPVDPAVQRLFDQANRAFYETVDWALDLREMEAQDFQLRGVPARLVRRDPATQVVVTRERAMRGDWRKLDLGKTYWDTEIETFLREGEPDRVFVAPKRDKDFKQLKAGLDLLRSAGVAEPD